MKKIILASGSPRRKQLLELAEVPFEVVVSAAEESYPPGLTPDMIAVHIAESKAKAVGRKLGGNKLPGGPAILAADTIVVEERTVIGKPKDRQDAIQILKRLSGKVHQVITGVCLLRAPEKILFSEVTEVEFRHLTLSQIEYYVDQYAPFDKAGAYAIQEWIGAVGIKSIRGDFYNVMGLPVSRVVEELTKWD